MNEFKMSNYSEIMPVLSKFGCFILSVLYGCSALSCFDVISVVKELIAKNIITDTMYINTYEGIIKSLSINLKTTKFNSVKDFLNSDIKDKFVFGIASTPGHCFSVTGISDEGLKLFDPGYQNDNLLTFDGKFTHNGVQKSTYKGSSRNLNSLRIFHV